MLTLDVNHQYWWNGTPLPSVTQIIKEAGLMGQYKGTIKRDRGTAIHKATELWDTLGVLPEDPEIIPFIENWEKYLTQSKITVLQSEVPVCNLVYGYAGTLDRMVQLPDGRLAVLDIKSGAPAKWHGLQLAAYALAWTIPCEIGIVVYLKETGYTTKPYLEIPFHTEIQKWIKLMGERNENKRINS